MMKTYFLPLLFVWGLGLAAALPNFKGFWDKEGINAFHRCLSFRLKSGKLVSRDLNSAEYNKLNLQWNLRLPKVYPLGYFLPTSAKDVAAAVKCGVKAKIPLIPNSGGHSYESIGWGNNRTLVVDFRKMTNIQVKGKGSKAVGIIEPGANVGQINAYLWENGKFAVPLGSCLPVAVGGHATGGGLGYYGPLFGLAMDNLIEIEGVDAGGNIFLASNEKNPDLFWALRGGGPAYLGIITRLKIKLHDVSKLKITFIKIHYTTEQFAQGFIAFQNFQKWLNKNDPSAYLTFMLASDQRKMSLKAIAPGMIISAIHYQHPIYQPNGNEAFLKAIKEYFPSPANFVLQANPNHIQFIGLTHSAPVIFTDPNTGKSTIPSSYEEYNQESQPGNPDEDDILKFIKMMRKEIALPHYTKVKTFFVKGEFTLEQMEKVGKVIVKIPPYNVWLLYNIDGGAIHRLARNATAYVHRDSIADFNLVYAGSPAPPDVKQGMQFISELWEAVQFMDSGETYQNYPDLDLVDSLQRNFKENYGRLAEEKRKWDPNNYFVSPLSLPLQPKQEL